MDRYLVAGGLYRCDSCTPPRAYPADGKLHPIADAEDATAESVRVTDPRSIVTRLVGKVMVRDTTMTVSADGKSATYVALDKWPGRADRLRTVYRAHRTAPAPPGAHPVSGAWTGDGYVEVPEAYRSIELHEAGDTLTRVNFRRGRYTATYGGPPAPISGAAAAGDYAARVARPDAHTRVETILQDGKPVTERTYRLQPDGRTLITTVKDLATGETFQITSHRKGG